ncbi:methylamine dehydrogenase accessory protein MauD [Oxalobacteraceae bacterium GrIS 2.11]
MNQAMWASQGVLWIVVAILVLAVLALARQVGVLYERVAPIGALITDSGPRIGDVSPSFNLTDLMNQPLSIGGQSASSTLVFFLSPTCPVCKKLLPILRHIQTVERSWLRIVLASDGEFPEHMAFYQKAQLTEFPYVLSSELGMAYRVSRLPYGVLIDEQGRIRSKGLVNSREQIESLFTAKELGVESIQQYVRQQA